MANFLLIAEDAFLSSAAAFSLTHTNYSSLRRLIYMISRNLFTIRY
jgi:hypothetical protein